MSPEIHIPHAFRAFAAKKSARKRNCVRAFGKAGLFGNRILIGEQSISEQIYRVVGSDVAVMVEIGETADGILFGEQGVSEQIYRVVRGDVLVAVEIAEHFVADINGRSHKAPYGAFIFRVSNINLE